jgi:glycosyltransferase involved in cell wall biosynthesis
MTLSSQELAPQDSFCGFAGLPLVSIIIPCYNAEIYVAEAIQSALDQSYPNCEIIVVDDGSTDLSLQVIKSFGPKIRWESDVNRGACAARNRGILLAKGKYLKFLDADDVLLTEAINDQVRASEGLSGDEIVFGLCVDYETGRHVFDRVRTGIGVTSDEMIFQCYAGEILTSCPLHRRGWLIERGVYFDTQLKRSQEWNFHLRIALAGGVFVFHNKPVYRYREHNAAGRISNVGGRKFFAIEAEKIAISHRAIMESTNHSVPPKLRDAMYVRTYGLARLLFRNKLQRDGREMLQLCDDLDPGRGAIGPGWYRLLVSLTSPESAERLISPLLWLKRLLSRTR